MSESRAYPHNLEAERALLGGLMQDPDRLPEVEAILAADDFYRSDHARLFALFVKMSAGNEPIDLVTVPERVLQGGREEQYGGLAYVTSLPDHAPSTANLGHYARTVKEKALLRRLIETSEGLTSEAYTQPGDVQDLLDRATREVLAVGEASERRGFRQISALLDQEVLRYQRIEDNEGADGTTTGFRDLDKLLAGLHPTDLIVLAARPGMGKTAFALNIAQNAAIMGGAGVGIFSMEMGADQLTTRMLCCRALVESGKVREGRLDPDDWEKLMAGEQELRKLQIHIDDSAGLTIGDVRSRSRRLKARVPELKLIVIDYLQLMSGDERSAPREQQISAISRGLKGLAKELEVTVIALSQLNRAVESRADKTPMLSDLRESGAIEQDADIILFIYRDEYYEKDGSEKKGLAKVSVAKQRNGSLGDVELVFRGQFARFDNYASDDLLG